MRRKVLICLLSSSVGLGVQAFATTLTVNCDKGQSVNAGLAKLSKTGPHTVTVSGTCTEDIAIRGFDDLQLLASPGTVLNKAPGSAPAVIDVVASSRIVIDGFTIEGPTLAPGVPATPTGIQFTGSVASSVSHATITGGGSGIIVDGSQARITDSTISESWAFWATVIVFDASIIELANVTLEAGHPYSTGLAVGLLGSAVVESGSFRDFGAGISVQGGGLVNPSNTGPVVFENNRVGLLIGPAAAAELQGDVQFIDNGDGSDFSGGIVVDGGALHLPNYSSLPGTVIRNSNGQGLVLMNNASARIGSVTIEGSGLNGIVVLNSSTLQFEPPIPFPPFGTSSVTGSAAKDVFCDSHSVVTGGAYITGATKITCKNLVSGPSVPLPQP